MTTQSQTLLINQDGPVLTVTLNRPDKLNAVNYELHEELAGIWPDLARRNDVRAVVLTGAGRAFCAGGDVKAFAAVMQEAAGRRNLAASGRAIVTEMLRFPVPIVAAVNGPAIGLGCSLALLSDVVIMSDDAFLADNHVQYGLVPGDGGFVWPMLTGMMQAKLPLFLGDRIDAAEAYRLGLATRTCPAEELAAQAAEIAGRIAALSTSAVRSAKRMLNLQIERAIHGVMDFAMAAEAAGFALRTSMTRTREREALVEIEFGSELDEFRVEIRAWIQRHRQPALVGLDAHELWADRRGGDAATSAAYAKWERAALEAHLVCPMWPAEYGGRGLSELELAIFEEELSRESMPRVIRYMSEYLVGPTIIAHGTAEQKAYFLPRIIDGTDRYCQGFSEPDHGSDLAGVATRAAVDGDEIVITGQKLWTSDATNSNMIFILCRTNSDVPKHKGLTFVLTDLIDNNITIRPLVQLSGLSGFCEEFIDGARAPLFNVIGGVDNGWAVAMTLLSSERGGLAISMYLPFQAELMELVEALRNAGKIHLPLVREHLAWMLTNVSLMRFGGLRILGSMLQPSQEGPHPSVSKLFWSEYHKRFGELVILLLGPTSILRPEGDGYPITRWQALFMASRSETILSGTSEIQRRIIGDRVLGLPRDV